MNFEYEYVLLCDFADIGAQKKINVIGIFNDISFEKLPSVHPVLYIATRFIANKIGKSVMRIQLVTPNGVDEGAAIEVPFSIERAGQPCVSIGKLENINFTDFGIYKFRITVDGETLREVSLNIKPLSA